MGHTVDLTISDKVFDQQAIGLTVSPECTLRVDQVLALCSSRKAVGEDGC
jgi:hypothetical protein